MRFGSQGDPLKNIFNICTKANMVSYLFHTEMKYKSAKFVSIFFSFEF